MVMQMKSVKVAKNPRRGPKDARAVILMPADLKRRAFAYAKEHGISFGELVVRLLENQLDNVSKKEPLQK